MYKIAISPSQQMDNRYSGVNTTEGIEMEKLAKLCHDYHISKGGSSLVFDHKGIDWRKRPQAAKDYGASIYLVLHTNAGGGKGPVTLHAKNSPNSKKLSTIINERLTTYFNQYGIPNTRYSPVQETNFLEAREPARLKMAHSYVEVNFHDNAEIARFMVKNWDPISKVIIDAIWEFRGWKEIMPKEGMARSTANVNLREGSTTQAKIIQLIRKGEDAKVIGLDGKWLKVEYNGKIGYTHQNYWKVSDETIQKILNPTKPAQDRINGPFVNADGERLYFRAVAGSYQTRQEAESAIEQLKAQGHNSAWLQAVYVKEK